jgi:hypothetical protein
LARLELTEALTVMAKRMPNLHRTGRTDHILKLVRDLSGLWI